MTYVSGSCSQLELRLVETTTIMGDGRCSKQEEDPASDDNEGNEANNNMCSAVNDDHNSSNQEMNHPKEGQKEQVQVVEAELVGIAASPPPDHHPTTSTATTTSSTTATAPPPEQPSSNNDSSIVETVENQTPPSSSSPSSSSSLPPLPPLSSFLSSSALSFTLPPPRELWQRYLSHIREYRTLLLAVDELLGHLLFFAPSSSYSLDNDADSSSSAASRWTEVLFGFLQLNRLSIDLATANSTADGTTLTEKNPFGASIATFPSRGFPATATRIALTVLQCIWPVAQELVRSSNNSKGGGGETRARRQARVRCVLERIRFMLRMTLLIQYWREMKQAKVAPGLLLEGGLYSGEANDVSGVNGVQVPTTEQEKSRLKRTNYTGRRTGRKVVVTMAGQERVRGETVLPENESSMGHDLDPHPQASPQGNDKQEEAKSLSSSIQSFLPKVMQPYINMTPSLGIMVGEVLAVSRPLLFAEVEARTSHVPTLYKVWLLCLSMDVTSLLTVKQSLSDLDNGSSNNNKNNSTASTTTTTTTTSTLKELSVSSFLRNLTSPHVHGNPVTQAEWKRRRMRLFLYLLRAPIWDQHTRFVAESLSQAVLGRVPLLGGLMQNYLWDWLYYWKLYRAEEG